MVAKINGGIKMTNEKADRTRNLVRREYDNVATRLRRIFDIPKDELVLSFEWDKNDGVLRLITLKD